MLRFQDVNYTYPGNYSGSEPVLSGLSFHIREGEQVGLIGANGAGKSTILKAALGLVKAEGTIDACGLPLTQKNLPEIRKKLGFVLQNSDNQMFMPTVYEDMIFGPMNYGLTREEADALVDETLEALGLSHLKYRHNHRMSGGEKRMAAIGVTLAMKPELLLMDEPSSSLDPKNRRLLIRTLKKLPVTKIIASHDLDMVLELCSRVIVIAGGSIAADGPAGEILRDKELLESCGLELPFCLAGPHGV